MNMGEQLKRAKRILNICFWVCIVGGLVAYEIFVFTTDHSDTHVDIALTCYVGFCVVGFILSMILIIKGSRSK